MKSASIIGGLLGALVLFLSGWLFYGILDALGPFKTTLGQKAGKLGADLSMPLLMAGHVVIGYITAILYSKWARGVHSFGHGAQLGAILGSLLGIGLGMIFFSTSHLMTGMGHLVDAIYYIVAYAIMGGVIGLVFSKIEN